jgi:NADH-quinone oxidoreductase subunit C
MSDDTPVIPESETPVPESRRPLPEDLARALGAAVREGHVEDGTVWLDVAPEGICATLEALRDKASPPYNHLSDVCGIDLGDEIGVVYHLFNLMSAAAAVVKVRLPRANPKLPTVTPLWRMADWAEREVAEMYGVEFVGHPDPRKLLLPDDWEGYPLRRDYVYPLEHPYLSPDPLREDPAAVLGGGAVATDE